MINLNTEEPMGHNSLKNVAVERAKDAKDGREAAGAASQGAGGRTIENLAINGAQWRTTKGDGLTETPAGLRGKTVMGRKSTEIGDQIGRELRGMFEEVVSQPVPDRFLDLLNRLESNTISPRANGKGA